jgi:hypothetical protein
MSARDTREITKRILRFDVVCLLELFAFGKSTAEDAVVELCRHLDDALGKGRGIWRFVISSNAVTDAHAKATADKAARGGKAASSAATAGVRNEQSAIVWRADSVICTSKLGSAKPRHEARAASGAAAAAASASSAAGPTTVSVAGDSSARGRLVSLPDGGGAASSHFFRPPLFASFRCGNVDFVVFAYHAAWGKKEGVAAEGDKAREVEYANLAVSIGSLRHSMQEAALKAIKNKPDGWEAAASLLWAPVLLCGDFNAELLASQQLFLPLRRIGGMCLQAGRQETVIAAQESDSHAYDMTWFFPAIATVDAVFDNERLLSQRDDADDGDDDDEADSASAAAASHAEATAPERAGEAAMLVPVIDQDEEDDDDDDDDDGDRVDSEAVASGSAGGDETSAEETAALSWMVEVLGYGVEDIMGEIRSKLVRRRILDDAGTLDVKVEPRADAVAKIAESFEVFGLPFASHSATHPEVQANALLSIARTLVVSCLSDHVPVWAEMSPLRMAVGNTPAARRALASAIRKRTNPGSVETELEPRWVELPPARVGNIIPAGTHLNGSPRVVRGKALE